MGDSHHSHVQRLWNRLAEEEKDVSGRIPTLQMSYSQSPRPSRLFPPIWRSLDRGGEGPSPGCVGNDPRCPEEE
jgi:hypothetical protein